MTRYSLYFKPGDDESRVFQYLDSDGAVVPLTGYTALWTGTVGDLSVPIVGTVDGVTGKVSILVSDAQTTALGAEGSFGTYDLVVTLGTVTTTISTGLLFMFAV